MKGGARAARAAAAREQRSVRSSKNAARHRKPKQKSCKECLSSPDVGEPAAGGKRRALLALQRAVHGLRATLLEEDLQVVQVQPGGARAELGAGRRPQDRAPALGLQARLADRAPQGRRRRPRLQEEPHDRHQPQHLGQGPHLRHHHLRVGSPWAHPEAGHAVHGAGPQGAAAGGGHGGRPAAAAAAGAAAPAARPGPGPVPRPRRGRAAAHAGLREEVQGRGPGSWGGGAAGPGRREGGGEAPGEEHRPQHSPRVTQRGPGEHGRELPLRVLPAAAARGLPRGVRRARRLLPPVAPRLLRVLPLQRAPRRPHLLLEERGRLVWAPLLREPPAPLRRLRRDHLLRGLPAGGRAGLAPQALCLPGVRDAADGQTLHPGQGQPAVQHLQPEQGLSRASGAPTRTGGTWKQQKGKVTKFKSPTVHLQATPCARAPSRA